MRLLKALASFACLFHHWYYWRTGAFGGFLKLLLPTGTGQPVLKEARTLSFVRVEKDMADAAAGAVGPMC